MGFPIKGSPAKNLPAVATCLERDWKAGTVLISASWSNPRMVEAYQGTAFVLLRTVRQHEPPPKTARAHRPDGTFADMHGALGGRKHVRIERVRSLPADVRRYFSEGDET